jgi:type II secretory pathway component PulJ
MSAVEPRALRSESGLSMVELLVSMMLAALLLVLVGTTFVQVVRTTASVNQARESNGGASNIMNALSKVIRSASTNAVTGSLIADPAIIAATDNSLTLYSYIDTQAANPMPTRVQFAIVGGQIVEKRWSTNSLKSPWTFPGLGTTPTRTQTYPGIQVPAGGTPLFTYLDATDLRLTAGNLVSDEQRKLIASVSVSLRIRPASPANAKPVAIVNTVGMPNVAIKRVAVP